MSNWRWLSLQNNRTSSKGMRERAKSKQPTRMNGARMHSVQQKDFSYWALGHLSVFQRGGFRHLSSNVSDSFGFGQHWMTMEMCIWIGSNRTISVRLFTKSTEILISLDICCVHQRHVLYLRPIVRLWCADTLIKSRERDAMHWSHRANESDKRIGAACKIAKLDAVDIVYHCLHCTLQCFK